MLNSTLKCHQCYSIHFSQKLHCMQKGSQQLVLPLLKCSWTRQSFRSTFLSATRSGELNSNNSREARVNTDGRAHFLKGFCLLLWAISLRPPTESALSSCRSLLFLIWNPQSTENHIMYPISLFFSLCTNIIRSFWIWFVPANTFKNPQNIQ